MDDETPPPPLTVRVCDSLTCALARRRAAARRLAGRLGAGVRVVRAPCMGGCDKAPVVASAMRCTSTPRVDSVAAAVAAGHTHPPLPPYTDLDAYRADGGYAPAARLPRRASARSSEIIGSARGFRRCAVSAAPAFRPGANGASCAQEPEPRLMAVNADEGEPGTFKDRYYPRNRPAPLPRGHADRAPGRSRPPTSTSICATNIRNAARS